MKGGINMKGKSRLKKVRAIKRLKKAIYITSFITIVLWALVFYLLLNFNKPQPTVMLQKTTIKEVKAIEVIKVKTAKITAYSCGGLKTNKEILMNCPSLFYGPPKTANGTEPIPYKTMACDPANMGKVFDIEGYGQVRCTDTGSAIVGEGRFDLYVSTVEEARDFGVQYLEYYQVEKDL